MGKDHIHNPVLKYKYIPSGIRHITVYSHIHIKRYANATPWKWNRMSWKCIHSSKKQMQALTCLKLEYWKWMQLDTKPWMPLFRRGQDCLHSRGQVWRSPVLTLVAKRVSCVTTGFRPQAAIGLMFSGVCFPEHPLEYPENSQRLGGWTQWTLGG